MKIKHLILGLSAAMLLAGCGGSSNDSSTSTTSGSEESSTSQHVEITSEQWDAAFEDVLNNFTYKATVDNTLRALLEFNETGFHEAIYDETGALIKNKEEYVQWTEDKTYSYSYDTTNEHWTKSETTAAYSTKEYEINNNKLEITFIGRFSDFEYDATKGGYFASATKTSEVEADGVKYGGFEVSNVLVTFEKEKITGVIFQFTGEDKDGTTVVNYAITSIGSTTFDFPAIQQ